MSPLAAGSGTVLPSMGGSLQGQHVHFTDDTRKALLAAVLWWMESPKALGCHLMAVILGVVIISVHSFLAAPGACHTHPNLNWLFSRPGGHMCASPAHSQPVVTVFQLPMRGRASSAIALLSALPDTLPSAVLLPEALACCSGGLHAVLWGRSPAWPLGALMEV